MLPPESFWFCCSRLILKQPVRCFFRRSQVRQHESAAGSCCVAFVCLCRQGLLALGGDLPLYTALLNVTLLCTHPAFHLRLVSRLITETSSHWQGWMRAANQETVLSSSCSMKWAQSSVFFLFLTFYFYFLTGSLDQPKCLWGTWPQVKSDHCPPEMFLWSMKVDRILE